MESPGSKALFLLLKNSFIISFFLLVLFVFTDPVEGKFCEQVEGGVVVIVI